MTIFYYNREELVRKINKDHRRVILMCDAGIIKTYGESFLKEINGKMIAVPTGEENKTRETKQKLEDQLLSLDCGKDTLIVAMGGGVTTDMVGFIASTFCRGVGLILIPTTLLGMVDAAIGGKNGVNTLLCKNNIGTVYPPEGILIDCHFLSTLPLKERLGGIIEAVKHGMIADEALFKMIESQFDTLVACESEEIFPFVQRNIEIKTFITSEDLRDKGKRHLLNAGHTVAHAIESAANYQVIHGEAVAFGLIAEARMAHLKGALGKEDLERIIGLCERCLSQPILHFSPKHLLKLMAFDKKSKDGQPRFVQIEAIGKAESFDGAYCTSIEPELIIQALEETYAHINNQRPSPSSI